MNNKSLGILLGLAIGLIGSIGCQNQEEAPSFLATSASGNGEVTIAGFKGAVSPGSTVTITNEDLGLHTSTKAGSDGSVLASIPGESGDALTIDYTDEAGDAQSAKVESEADLVSVHGLLTFTDPDGEDGEQKPCVQLHRDDVDPDADDALLRIVPPKMHSDDQPPPPEDVDQPPPPEDGDQPPPPEDGGQCHGGEPRPDVEGMDGTKVTVIGQFVKPPEDSDGPENACPGLLFEGHEFISDEEGATLTMEGEVEKTVAGEGEDAVTCWTFRRTDVTDASGRIPTDLLGVYELSGGEVENLSDESTTIHMRTLYLHDQGPCGFAALALTGFQERRGM